MNAALTFSSSQKRIDKFVSTSLLSNPHYRIIRNDRKKGAGGLLVYIHNSIKARRQPKLEPSGVESICLNVKGNNNTWFFLCACYRSPNKCKVIDFISSCSVAAENMLKIRSELVFIGDFNIDMMNYVSTPALSQDALDLSPEDFSNHPSVTSISLQNFNLAFSFQPVSAEYIGKLLSELKINKSCGPDNNDH